MGKTRLSEPEARILALRIAAGCKGRSASTAFIKSEIQNYIVFTPIDLKPSSTRLQEQKWQQIVGNVVSHKSTSTSIFHKGYAERTTDGIRVTDAGAAYLKGLGF